MKCSLSLIISACCLIVSPEAFAQRPGTDPIAQPGAETPGVQAQGLQINGQNIGEQRFCVGNLVCAAVEVELKGEDGEAIDGTVAVSLIKENGQVIETALAHKGKVRFGDVPKTALTAQVVAPGFQTAKKVFEVLSDAEVKVKIELQPMADKEAAASQRAIAELNPKAQKDVGKALQALLIHQPTGARNHLEAAERNAPNSAEVQYLFGVYASQLKNEAQAQAHWMKALELNPKHLNALLALSQGLLQDGKPAEAAPYLARALDAEPSSWRAHMLTGQMDLLQGDYHSAQRQAERSMELGHEQATAAQILLAQALYETGDEERAIRILQNYVASQPADTYAKSLLERITQPRVAIVVQDKAEVKASAAALPVPSNWLPPDVDEKTPQVESGAACSVNDVVQKAGKQIEEFVHNVDRFTATELLTSESIDKYGIASSPEMRKFDYLVSIQEVRQGHLSVTEYRKGKEADEQFPDGIATNGLPALILIFHPYYAQNYQMTCEGLSRMNGVLAWQVHFRQRQDKPNELQTYQIGLHGSSYSIGLKGRAWFSAESYQILRLETDIVEPVPQLKLLAEHTRIDYGPVNFTQAGVKLWLPQSVELYFARKGKQSHRWHSFNNYMLFAVDDRQRIAVPKAEESSTDPDRVSSARP
jgi:tetratricopeptide (TPR) repeat protein